MSGRVAKRKADSEISQKTRERRSLAEAVERHGVDVMPCTHCSSPTRSVNWPKSRRDAASASVPVAASAMGIMSRTPVSFFFPDFVVFG
ncbi:hypothetical protein CH063_13853 [Colletotrichum higginsianum]|uniref:Uncharacterized protein n=1 Tax=Colletotrichum higginsianum (strain IMI 349063) TaxID=759273 RepID=H1VW50_COLHI|nr:hypothetical protein CH063_13853 [Colletotrichum higginsianum]